MLWPQSPAWPTAAAAASPFGLHALAHQHINIAPRSG